MLDLPDVDNLAVAFDTETSGLHPDDGARISVVSLAWFDDQDVMHERGYAFDQGDDTPLGLKTGLPKKYKGPGLFDPQPPNLGMAEWHQLMAWLDRQLLIGHNLKYDLLMAYYGLRNNRDTGYDLSRRFYWDTAVVTSLLWPNEKVGLKTVAARMWGAQEAATEEAVKKWLKVYCGKQQDYRYDLVPWDLIDPYARQDTVLTLRLYRNQVRNLEEGLLPWGVVYRELDFAALLTRMEMRGVGFDREAAAAAGRQLYRMELETGKQLAKAVNIPVLPTDAYLRDWWFGDKLPGALGIKPWKTTGDGKPAMTLDVVRTLIERGVPGAVEYQRHNKVSTARSMWYEPWPRRCGEDNRLRCVYHQTKMEDAFDRNRGTVSGRLAVERIQLQAQPHDYQCPEGVEPMSRFFKPRPGYRKGEVDISQAEVRVAAHLANCRPLIDSMNAGLDPHSVTCSLMFQMDETHPEWDFHRGVAKRLVFGNLYGAGVPTIAAQILQFTGRFVSDDQCGSFLETFRSTYPELQRESYRSDRLARSKGYVELQGGRLRWFRFGELTHKAWNARIQGGVAEVMKMAMIDIEYEMPGVLNLQIHDSLGFEVPEEQFEDTKAFVSGKILEHFEREFYRVKFKVDAK